MIELCCENLSVQCIWLYVLIMSHTRFRVNLYSYSCLNSKELLTQNRSDIWILSDCNVNRIRNYFVCKWTLNYLGKLANWLGCVVKTYLYSAFDYMILWCHICVLGWIYNLKLPDCQGTNILPPDQSRLTEQAKFNINKTQSLKCEQSFP